MIRSPNALVRTLTNNIWRHYAVSLSLAPSTLCYHLLTLLFTYLLTVFLVCLLTHWLSTPPHHKPARPTRTSTYVRDAPIGTMPIRWRMFSWWKEAMTLTSWQKSRRDSDDVSSLSSLTATRHFCDVSLDSSPATPALFTRLIATKYSLFCLNLLIIINLELSCCWYGRAILHKSNYRCRVRAPL